MDDSITHVDVCWSWRVGNGGRESWELCVERKGNESMNRQFGDMVS